MSITVVEAKKLVADVIGGRASQEALDMAGDALRRSYQDWQAKRFWRFLLRDTSLTTAVASVTVASGNASVSPPSVGAFDFVNVNQTVSGTNIQADTVVSAFTRGSDGVITAITLSLAPTGNGTVTLTFGANIPIVQGTNEYNLPSDWYAAFTARTLVVPRPLTWRDQRYWDRVMTDQTVLGTPQDYTTYNPISDLTQNFGTTRLKFDRIPSEDDTLFLRYYRKFNPDGTYLDMPNEYVYQFIDYARNVLLALKTAQDNPSAFAKSTGAAAQSAAESDDEPTEDNDVDQIMKSQYEMGSWNRALWGNGDFDPYRY